MQFDMRLPQSYPDVGVCMNSDVVRCITSCV